MPPGSFGGRGEKQGPLVIMTDNCGELRDALRNTWPQSFLLLCIFHILQQIWHWLFDKNPGISQNDREEILLLFKAILYEPSEENMESMFEDMLQSRVVSQHNNLVTYLLTLYDYKTSWALCYRQDLRTRGHNTNNNVESQFLVLKDDILNRTKEININGLLDKLLIDFMDHYKVKLLNISSGKFDGTYAPRFKGLTKSKGGLGFKLPNKAQIDTVLSKLVKLSENIFVVPSFSTDGVVYTVDMNVGVYECDSGKEGSICKHQYVLWANRKVPGINFLPYLSASERKQYAMLAIGKSMPIEFYEGIHNRINQSTTDDICSSDTHNNLETDTYFQSEKKVPITNKTNRLDTVERVTPDECKQGLQEALKVIEEKLHTSNTNLMQGVLKFCKRVKSYQISRLSSALHTFGTQGKSSLKVTATSALKKAKREAIKRRKSECGSRKAVLKGQNKRKNPFETKVGATKRAHKFSANVTNNEAISKKAGCMMFSKTRQITKQNGTETSVAKYEKY